MAHFENSPSVKNREAASGSPSSPTSAWQLYDRLIEGIPRGIQVKDCCLGLNWSYLEAECGMGVSFTCTGGAPRTCHASLRGQDLREVAQLAKSWCFAEATLGTAAINAWYNRAELLDPLGAVYDEPAALPAEATRSMDAFEAMRPQVEAAEAAQQRRQNVVVVGHFPHVEKIADYANLTVLERKCSHPDDTPDPACEYVMPLADYAFVTGVALINKTAPRLLQLAQQAVTVLVGPSVTMSETLFDFGADMLAGSVVNDADKARAAVKSGAGKLFGEAIRMAMAPRRA
ncbi:MAG: DUF364 domain-containing protein [Eggerthellaceae bacterium]|nr:DUF364 domain-containing protein [Eggerthellaceae bacterium]